MRSLIWLIPAALLAGCSQTAVLAAWSEEVRPPALTATLDAGNSGLAAYYCRRAFCAGDDAQNQPVRAFVAFELKDLPPNPRATLRLYQGEASTTYDQLGHLLVERIRVDNLQDPAAFDAPALFQLENRTGGEGWLEFDLTPALRAARAEGATTLQLRLRFQRPTNFNHRGDLALYSLAPGYAPELVLRPGD
ncbi:hypothetical protein DV704_05025 [Meiothermus sp. QL-1]|uniref:hypothetical protein n=1 Tax=Meiothermus sp. QL-1 TaxID=2058095 RepID=UPI000E0C375D|nr:hypothetical protein [Meiothermus sp. QL-1]RDI95646.1 hypothetical protein DV704_05025 [Meiothermus sp. QL-1]